MKLIYFWTILASCICSLSRSCCGERINAVHPHPHRQDHKSSNGASKHAERKFSDNPNRRLSGRHVCTQSKVTMIPIKDVQSYCKPVYQSYLRRCDKDNSRYCSGYRVAYELGYRSVQRMIAKTESVSSCCPGWTQVRASSADCKRALCREECLNGGSCSKPDHCSCASGWSGKTCATDVDECSSRKETCDHDCMNTPGSYKCSCKSDYILQPDGRKCEKKDTRIDTEYDAEISKKMEDIRKRLDALEEWQQRVSADDKSEDRRHQRDDRINSLSEQIAILEERLEEYRKKVQKELRSTTPAEVLLKKRLTTGGVRATTLSTFPE